MKNYEEGTVVAQLNKKNDLDIKGKQIQVIRTGHGKGDVGIRSKGKIDFLTNYCGYVIIPTDKFF